MRILVLGSTGMLGSAVGHHFDNTNHAVTLTYRNSDVAYGKKRTYYNANMAVEILPSERFDYVINCIGTIKPFMSSNPREARFINSVFPWDLAEWCDRKRSKLIHITTDCVYTGKKGLYVESDEHDATDDYGKSKSLGEPTNCMVLRTSIIGEELHKNASLLEWAKSQKGKQVKGFTNHYWNGITTKQYAKVCEEIINNNLWERGLFHIHASGPVVSKCQMLYYFDERFQLGLNVEPCLATTSCDRSLSSEKDFCMRLGIPTVSDQILDM